jgi:YidC/Oxa1 family membrane protein insertase
MDRKSLFILVAAVVVLLMLSGLVNRLFPPIPVPVMPQAAITNQAANPPTAANAATNAPPAAPGAATTPPPIASVPTVPETTLVVSNQDLIFHFTSRGGGLRDIMLRSASYPAVVHSARRPGDMPSFATLDSKVPVPILATLEEDPQGEDNYTLSQPAKGVVRAEKTLANGLRVVKEFAVGDSGTNFLFTAKMRLENETTASLLIPKREVVAGTATVIGPLDDLTALGAMWYDGAKRIDIGSGWFANRTLGCFPGTPRAEYQEGASNVVWAAMHSQYFALVAIPARPAPGIVIRNLKLPPADTNELATVLQTSRRGAQLITNNYEGYQAAFVYPATRLEPRQALEQTFIFYAGPKEFNGLASLGSFLGNNLDQVMGFTGFLGIFGFVTKFLLLSMNGLHGLGLSYGLCIIAITVIIKLVFWPLTAASTRSQKRQQAIAPQLKAIADKYKEDPLKKHQKTTELMKEHKINPLGSCLPVLITIPVFIGFYYMLRNAIELRGVSFLWATDLTLPDTVGTIGGFPFNPLPLLMGASQLWQSHLTPPSPGMDPGQQKIMRWMPLLFVGIFYQMSSGLNLYYTVSNLLTIAQTKITKMGPDPAGGPVKNLAPAPQKKK